MRQHAPTHSEGNIIRVLHVDDDPEVTALTARSLERIDARFDVVTEHAPTDALARLRDDTIDCVVSDYEMPELDGLELLEEVRERYPDLPFVLYTGEAGVELGSRALSQGADEYMRKQTAPEQYDLLANRIVRLTDVDCSPVEARGTDDAGTKDAAALDADGTVDDAPTDFDESEAGAPGTPTSTPADASRPDPSDAPVGVAFENAAVGLAVCDPETGVVQVANRLLRNALGVESLAGDPLWDALATEPPYTIRRLRELLDAATESGEYTADWQCPTEQGPRAVELTLQPVVHRGRQRVLATIDGLDDGDDPRRPSLEEASPRVVERSPGGVLELDADGTVVATNEGARELFGYDRDRLRGESIRALVADGFDGVTDFLDDADERPVETRWLVCAERADGTEFPVEMVVHRMEADDSAAFVASVGDVSDRRRLRVELQKNQRALKELHDVSSPVDVDYETRLERLLEIGCDRLDATSAAVIEFDDDSGRVAAARTAGDDFGRGTTLSLSNTVLNHVRKTPRPVVVASDDPAASSLTDRFGAGTYVVQTVDCEEDRYGAVLFADAVSEGGFTDVERTFVQLLARWIGQERDRDQYKSDIEQSRQQLRQLVDLLPQLVFVKNRDNEYLLANEAVAEGYGTTPEEMEGQTDYDLSDHKSEAKKFHREDLQVIESGEQLTIESNTWTTADRKTRVLRTKKIPYELPGSDERAVLGVSVDVTEEHRREEQLRLLQQTTWQLLEADDESDIYRTTLSAIRDLLPLSRVGIWRRTDSEGYEAITTMPEDECTQLPAALDAVGDDIVHSGDVTVQQSDDGNAVAVALDDERILVGTGPATDIDATEREYLRILASNLTTTRERLNYQWELERQNDRLEKFVSVVSHDLRNPLHVADARVRLVQEHLQEDDDVATHLDTAASSLVRMDQLIDDLLTLARHGNEINDTEQVAPDAVARRAWGTADTPEATLEVDDDFDYVQADPAQLRQLFENLFRNAVDHGPETVTVSVEPLEDGFAIADDGPGIPEEDRDDVFEHGFTTSDDGTGFGLSIVETIVTAHDWTIDVTESDAGGARFEVRTE